MPNSDQRKPGKPDDLVKPGELTEEELDKASGGTTFLKIDGVAGESQDDKHKDSNPHRLLITKAASVVVTLAASTNRPAPWDVRARMEEFGLPEPGQPKPAVQPRRGQNDAVRRLAGKLGHFAWRGFLILRAVYENGSKRVEGHL